MDDSTRHPALLAGDQDRERSVELLVPEGIDVSVVGGGMFASQVIQPPPAHPVPGAPKLRISVRGPGGTLYVRSRDAATEQCWWR